MMTDNDEIKPLIEDWVRQLHAADPIGCWVSEGPEVLDINFEGDVETRIHKIGPYYLIVTNGGGADASFDWYQSIAEVSDHMKHESERGNPEDGWEFSVKDFNKLEDQYGLLPDNVKELVTPWEIICLLTEWDDDISEWLLYG